MPIKIRKATSKDFDELAKLYAEQLNHTNSLTDSSIRVDVKNKKEFEASLRKMLNNKDFGLFIAAADGAPVAFANASLHKRPIGKGRFGYINDLFVTTKYRRKGIAKQLVSEVEKWAKSRGADAIRLGSVVRNRTAIRVWPKLGYKRMAIEFDKDLK